MEVSKKAITTAGVLVVAVVIAAFALLKVNTFKNETLKIDSSNTAQPNVSQPVVSTVPEKEASSSDKMSASKSNSISGAHVNSKKDIGSAAKVDASAKSIAGANSSKTAASTKAAINKGGKRSVAGLVNIKDKGAKGDGRFDNWLVFQKTIDSLAINGGGTIYIPSGSYAIFDKGLEIWGEGITIQGESAGTTTILKKGSAGYFGDCIDVVGKLNGDKYYGNFGNGGDYNRLVPYTGDTEPARNIHIKNLTIATDASVMARNANNLGILNSENVYVDNCIIKGAPQTNVAIVNDTKRSKNGIIKFTSCQFKESGQHSVRVCSYNQGSFIGNDVTFYKCTFSGTKDNDSQIKEVIGKKILLWYRGSVSSGLTHVNVDQCDFDDSGTIYANSNVSGLTVQGSIMSNQIIVQHANKVDPNPNIVIKNNTFRNRRKLGLSLSAAAGNNGSVVSNSARIQMSNNKNQDQ
ncbi:glycosyl hydrolase family 28-related protein [Mucilaginibacter sp.]|nr:glycosyl hydrolase family 28-related protein [Mucilaginibacter sp.]